MYYWERWYFFLPKIWSYHLDGKWKMTFLKKIHGNMIFSSNVLKGWSFQKGPHWDMIFLVLSGKMVFFPKIIFFPWAGNERWSFSRNTLKYDIFLCTRTGVTNVAPRHSAKRNQKWSYPTKIHVKVIDVWDWHSKKSPSNSPYFHGDLYRRFHVLLSSQKN